MLLILVFRGPDLILAWDVFDLLSIAEEDEISMMSYTFTFGLFKLDFEERFATVMYWEWEDEFWRISQLVFGS